MTGRQAEAALLATLASDCAALGIRRQLVLLRLPPSLTRRGRGAARRGLAELLAPLAGADRGQLFRLPGGHLAASWREQARDHGLATSGALADLREALAACPDAENGELLMLELPEDAPKVQAFLDGIQAAEAMQPAAPGEALDRAELEALEAALAHADLALFARRFQVWERQAEGLAPAWEHRFLDLAELAARMSPGRALRAEPFLFARLSRTLDRRLLALLADPRELRDAGPFGIDLSPASILDPAFQRFDRSLPGRLRGQVVLRLPVAELALLPDLVAPAVQAARARDYRVLLAAGSPLMAALFPRAGLGADLIELEFPCPGEGFTPPEGTVLTGIGDAAGIAWAARHEVRFLAGPMVDQMARTQGQAQRAVPA